jgi:antitoxin component of RelBE/YafQ-DinJ toxin-antitoxin module
MLATHEISQKQGQKVRSNVYLDATLKENAKEMFKVYGLSFSDGLNLLLKQATDKQSPILINNLDIKPIYPDDPDYKLMKKAREESSKTYTLEEAFGIVNAN